LSPPPRGRHAVRFPFEWELLMAQPFARRIAVVAMQAALAAAGILAIMLVFSRARGLYLPKGKELAWACFSGLLTLGIGNGALVASETMIPSGIAGLIVTISPFWLIGVEALMPGGERLHAPTIGGMAVGLAGAALLFTPDAGGHAIAHNLVYGFLVLQLGMAGWSFGSILQRRQSGKAHPVVAASCCTPPGWPRCLSCC